MLDGMSGHSGRASPTRVVAVGCEPFASNTQGSSAAGAVCEHSGGTTCPHSSGWSPNAALWAEMRYPVHGRPPTFAEHRDGVIVGVKSGAVI
jgi:hypothetical protein